MTLELHGKHLIGGETSAEGRADITAVNPGTTEVLDPLFFEATPSEVDRALDLAGRTFDEFRTLPAARIAAFLDSIAEQIMELGDQLLERCHEETGLPMPRLIGERARTVNQARLFAELVREGSWVDARIDRADPNRQPLPKPDVRLMLAPIGPVVVFGASNFPLAISVAGSDTVSALAAGCPVVVKAHRSHPGTSELVGRAIVRAAKATRMPAGVFALLQGSGRGSGMQLVNHPLTRAVGFTGSLNGGMALFKAAVNRPEPIPVYAEMGSINPVFLLPSALKERGQQVAEGFYQSMTLGVGQFCTQPGLAVGLEGPELDAFVARLSEMTKQAPAWTMLNAGICRAYAEGVERLEEARGVRVAGRPEVQPDARKTQGTPAVFVTDAATFLSSEELSEEVFGPCSVVVTCQSTSDLESVAENLVGHLSATVHGTPDDLQEYQRLVRTLEGKVGRLIFNGFPTGIEVCSAMHHGGPYPATTFSHFTSIGTNSIMRWVRPMCYQNFPDQALPEPLQNSNPRKIWRLVDNVRTRE
jgi:NADP-dependent aldehyde dehydrogenase